MMMLETAVGFSHSLLKKRIQQNDIVIDGTVGNSNDTVFLAQLVGSTGKVIGFDIQKDAIESTQEKLVTNGVTQQVELHQVGHENVERFLKKDQRISAAIYNLGYLPGGDKEITTEKDTTLQSISSLLPFLEKQGLLMLVVYSGHPNGLLEKEALVDYAEKLDQSKYSVLLYQFTNQKNNPPFLIAIEKR